MLCLRFLVSIFFDLPSACVFIIRIASSWSEDRVPMLCLCNTKVTLGVFSAYTPDTSDLIRSSDFKHHLASFCRIVFQITSSYTLLLVKEVATVRHCFLNIYRYNDISVLFLGREPFRPMLMPTVVSWKWNRNWTQMAHERGSVGPCMGAQS